MGSLNTVPFEEDDKDPTVWFLDHNYIESMSDMFKKVNAREKLIGWYHTGPKLRASDLEINELFKRYTPHPILVIIDVAPKEIGVPTDAYFAIEEIKGDGTTAERTFVHTPSVIVAEEAEEIGVEHLLRDIRDVAVGTLSARITGQLQSLQGLHLRLRDIGRYLDRVARAELPVNHAILGNLQDVFNLLPGLNAPLRAASAQRAAGRVQGQGHLANGTAKDAPATVDGPAEAAAGESELTRAMSVKTNDQLMSIYLSSLVRAITAFHDLIENKIQNRQQAEERAAAGQERKKAEDDKDKNKEKGKEVNGAAVNGESREGAKEGGKKADDKGKGRESKR